MALGNAFLLACERALLSVLKLPHRTRKVFKTAGVTLRTGHVRLGPPMAEVKSQKGLQVVTAWWLAIADVFKCAARAPCRGSKGLV